MGGAGESIVVEVQTDRDRYRVGEPVRMRLRISNNGAVPVELVFPSAQRYDFVVFKDGEEVWRWSRDRVFAMVLGVAVLKPGEGKTFVETWRPAGCAPGKYRVVGMVVSKPAFEAACMVEMGNAC